LFNEELSLAGGFFIGTICLHLYVAMLISLLRIRAMFIPGVSNSCCSSKPETPQKNTGFQVVMNVSTCASKSTGMPNAGL
jgi:hypothetical protein